MTLWSQGARTCVPASARASFLTSLRGTGCITPISTPHTSLEGKTSSTTLFTRLSVMPMRMRNKDSGTMQSGCMTVQTILHPTPFPTSSSPTWLPVLLDGLQLEPFSKYLQWLQVFWALFLAAWKREISEIGSLEPFPSYNCLVDYYGLSLVRCWGGGHQGLSVLEIRRIWRVWKWVVSNILLIRCQETLSKLAISSKPGQ